MLAENLENLVKKERLEGRQEEKRKLIGLKLGGFLEWAQKRLDEATPDQLEDWIAATLVADSLRSLLSEH